MLQGEGRGACGRSVKARALGVGGPFPFLGPGFPTCVGRRVAGKPRPVTVTAPIASLVLPPLFLGNLLCEGRFAQLFTKVCLLILLRCRMRCVFPRLQKGETEAQRDKVTDLRSPSGQKGEPVSGCGVSVHHLYSLVPLSSLTKGV